MVSSISISDAYQVETQLLSTFVTVARLGSFSAAAIDLGYTQAAVSQQIAALESELKVKLLTRRPVAPTEAGTRLLEHAKPLLLRLAAARADVARMTATPAATLVIGVTPLAGGAPPLARSLAALRQRMPRLAVTVRVASGTDTAISVARGECDIGVLDGLAAPGDSLEPSAPLSAAGVAESRVAVVLPAGHPLAGRSGARLADLVDARWIDAPGVAPSLADIRRVARMDGFRPALHYTGTDTLSLIRLASAGHGLTLLPTAALPAASSEFHPIPVTRPQVVHRIELVHGTLRAASPAAALAGLLSPR